MFCPKCGAPNDNKNVRCVKCGNALQAVRIVTRDRDDHSAGMRMLMPVVAPVGDCRGLRGLVASRSPARSIGAGSGDVRSQEDPKTRLGRASSAPYRLLGTGFDFV